MNAYDINFNKFISCWREYQLKKMEEQLPALQAKGSFERCVKGGVQLRDHTTLELARKAIRTISCV